MRRGRLALLVILAGCSGKKKEATPSPPPPSPSAPAIVERRPVDFNVSCDRFLTQELLAKWFPGRALQPGNDKVASWSRSCLVGDPKAMAGTMVQISCGGPYVNDETMKKQEEQATQQHFEVVPGLGRWAARRGGDLRLWDKDAPCFFLVSRFTPPEKVVDFGRDLEASSGPDDFDDPSR